MNFGICRISFIYHMRKKNSFASSLINKTKEQKLMRNKRTGFAHLAKIFYSHCELLFVK